MKHPQFHKLDPMRRPDWRLQRALALLEAGQTPRRPGRYDDEQVRCCYKHLRIMRDADPAAVAEVEGRAPRGVDAAALAKYFKEYAGLWYAFRIYTSTEREWRWMVQSALLAREDDAQIAQRLGTLPDVIRWYHDLFFDVRDRLDAKHLILKIIRGPWAGGMPNRDGSPTENQQGVDLMLSAYFGGSLPTLEPDGGGGQEPSDLDIGIDAFLREFPPELLPSNPKSP